MPTNRETFPIEVVGGLVTNLPPIQQGSKLPGSARRLVNFENSIKGGYRRINGFTKWDINIVPTVTSSSQVLGVGFFDGAVVAAREGKIYTSTGSGWTQIATGRTQTTKHRFTRFNFDGTRKIMGLDSSNYPYTWDGSSFVNVNGTTDVLACTHAVAFKDHMFYAKADLVTYSIPFDETDFTVANGSGNFRMPGDVTGMIVFRKRLFIFTEEEIKVLDGSSLSDFILTSVSEDVGCVSEDTIQEVAGDIAFLSADGVRLLGATDRIGDFSNALSSKSVQSDLTDFTSTYNQFSSVVIRGKSQYRVMGWVSGRDSTLTEGFIGTQAPPEGLKGNHQEHDFHWSVTKGIKSYSSDSVVYTGTEYVIFAGDTEYVYRLDNGDDFDGTAITSSYWTPYLTFNDPMLRKTMYKKSMYFGPEGDVTGSVNLNFDLNDSSKIQPPTITFSASGGGVVFGSGVFGTSTYRSAPSAIVDCLLVGSGFNVSLKFEFTASNEPFIIDTILVEHSTEDRR
ncbi:MAG: hypothetical protein COA78_20320 [Blastopirellula sp.]|nr:MAG: hypothetical protein COA78_20320 [Blastopirellula sp.]